MQPFRLGDRMSGALFTFFSPPDGFIIARHEGTRYELPRSASFTGKEAPTMTLFSSSGRQHTEFGESGNATATVINLARSLEF